MQYGGIFWEIDLWGRIRAQKAAAEAGFEATALDYAFGRQSVAATTAKSWYLAIETRQLVALAEQAVEIYTRLLELVKIRRAAGKVADLDVAEASANLNSAESDLRIAQGLYSEARRALELLLGRYPAAEIEISAAFAPLPQPVAAGLPSSLLERRPDIMAAERQVLAAFRTEEAAKLALLPAISLNFEGGRLSDRILDLVHLNPALYRAAIGMSVPIFTGGALTAQIKIATAAQAQTVARYGSVVLEAFREVETTLTNEALLAQRAQFDQRALEDRTAAVQIAAISTRPVASTYCRCSFSSRSSSRCKSTSSSCTTRSSPTASISTWPSAAASTPHPRQIREGSEGQVWRKIFEQEQTELTESFLKSSVSSVTSCEKVTSGVRVSSDEGKCNVE
jgi:outer membrane protein TolC